MNDMHDDDLDRALFALPPADLHDRILTATIARRAGPVFRQWEIDDRLGRARRVVGLGDFSPAFHARPALRPV
jgi:hypothetical protein